VRCEKLALSPILTVEHRGLGAHLAGLAPNDLPKCREMAMADPRYSDGLDEQATHEIKEAIGATRSRLDELAAAATEELTRAKGS
jgi:hypothetical protein